MSKPNYGLAAARAKEAREKVEMELGKYRNLERFQELLRKGIHAAIKDGAGSKSGEGEYSVTFPGQYAYEDCDAYRISLTLYVFGPSRRYTWYAKSLGRAADMAYTSLAFWLHMDSLCKDIEGYECLYKGLHEKPRTITEVRGTVMRCMDNQAIVNPTQSDGSVLVGAMPCKVHMDPTLVLPRTGERIRLCMTQEQNADGDNYFHGHEWNLVPD